MWSPGPPSLGRERVIPGLRKRPSHERVRTSRRADPGCCHALPSRRAEVRRNIALLMLRERGGRETGSGDRTPAGKLIRQAAAGSATCTGKPRQTTSLSQSSPDGSRCSEFPPRSPTSPCTGRPRALGKRGAWWKETNSVKSTWGFFFFFLGNLQPGSEAAGHVSRPQ